MVDHIPKEAVLQVLQYYIQTAPPDKIFLEEVVHETLTEDDVQLILDWSYETLLDRLSNI